MANKVQSKPVYSDNLFAAKNGKKETDVEKRDINSTNWNNIIHQGKIIIK